MKKFMQRVQDLNQKATQIREAIKQAPAQVAQVREAVTASAAQLQQMRMNVQSSVNDLKVTDDQQLLDALTEIDRSHDFFRQAGFSVEGVDVEVGVMSKLVVHLRKAEHVPPGMVRSLISGHPSEKTCASILTAILRAEELEGKIRLEHFEYSEAVVDMGMMPTVRLCWWPTGSVAPVAVTPPPLPPVIQNTPIPVSTKPTPMPATATVPPTSTTSPQGQGSFFGTPAPYTPVTTPTSTPAPAAATALTPQPVPAPPPVPSLSGYNYTPTPTTDAPKKVHWGRESLDRFKKMPDLGR